MRMRIMVEQDKKPDAVELEFREMEAKLVEKIKIAQKESLKKFPAGVSVEIASSGEKDFRLYIDSNGKWSMRYQMSGFEIGGKPNLSRILDSFLFVTDALYRNLELSDREHYLQTNRSEFTVSLFDRMQTVLTELG